MPQILLLLVLLAVVVLAVVVLRVVTVFDYQRGLR
jgi:hypothetical protein